MKIHLFGYLKIDSDDSPTLCDGNGRNFPGNIIDILDTINRYIFNGKYINKDIKEEDYEEFVPECCIIPNVEVSLFTSDNKMSLEEVQTKCIENALGIGTLETQITPYGYSVWTITGFDLDKFKLVNENGGEHDLNEILHANRDKYVHIIFDLLDEPTPLKEDVNKVYGLFMYRSILEII